MVLRYRIQAAISWCYSAITVTLTTTTPTGCRFQQAELVHCRWAMLGVVGILFPEVSTPPKWSLSEILLTYHQSVQPAIRSVDDRTAVAAAQSRWPCVLSLRCCSEHRWWMSESHACLNSQMSDAMCECRPDLTCRHLQIASKAGTLPNLPVWTEAGKVWANNHPEIPQRASSALTSPT